MSFTIKFDDLEQISKNIMPSDILNRIVPDVNSAVAKFHNTLENRIEALYTLKSSLGSVLVSSKTPINISNVSIDYQLVYQKELVPLADYEFNNKGVPSATARYPRRLPNKYISWVLKGYAIETKTEIRRGKPKIARRGKGNYRYKGFEQNNVIYARMQKATWKTYPSRFSEGTRAPFVALYGPTLARLAESTYEKDAQMQVAKDKLADDISNAFTKGWK